MEGEAGTIEKTLLLAKVPLFTTFMLNEQWYILTEVWHHITWKMNCMWLTWRKGLYLVHISRISNLFTWTNTGIFLYSYQLSYLAEDIQEQLMAVVFCVCCIVQCQRLSQMRWKIWPTYVAESMSLVFSDIFLSFMWTSENSTLYAPEGWS